MEPLILRLKYYLSPLLVELLNRQRVRDMNGLLAVWNDCDETVLEKYEHWYMNEHLPDRVGLWGVQQGVRYQSTNPLPQTVSPRFFTSYDLDDVSVLEAPAYQAALLNPTPDTQFIMAYFKNMCRTIGRLVDYEGRAAGAWVVTLRVGQIQGGDQPRHADLDAWQKVLRVHAPAAACRWRLYESVLTNPLAARAPAVASPSPEARFRPGADTVAHGVVIIEHLRFSDLKHTISHWLSLHDVQTLLHPLDRVDDFLEMARLDARAMAHFRLRSSVST